MQAASYCMAFYDPVAFTGLVVLQRNIVMLSSSLSTSENTTVRKGFNLKNLKGLFPLFPQHFLLLARLNVPFIHSVQALCPQTIKVLKAPMTSFSECFSEVLIVARLQKTIIPKFFSITCSDDIVSPASYWFWIVINRQVPQSSKSWVIFKWRTKICGHFCSKDVERCQRWDS